MKLKRDEFKAMMKECILELFQEGKIFQNATPPTQGRSPGPQQLNEDGTPEGYTPNSRLNEAVKMTAHMVAKGDKKVASMYEGIFADTARTTLQKQLATQMGSSGLSEGAVLPEERQHDQAQLGMFEASNRWAQLAFGKKITSDR